jgi:D-alanyl-D-alanine carboxypeptidase
MVVVALVAAAAVFAGPVPCTEAPTRLLADIVIPARPTALQRDAITLRETYHLPALELCVIDADRIVEAASGGVRKAGGAAAVEESDLFHLGSMTKAMTATMLSTLVQEGKLSWDMTMVQAFPSLASVMDLEM